MITLNQESWIINFYNQNIKQEILEYWPDKLRARLFKILDVIKKDGPNLGMPITRSMGNGLFEIRVKAYEGIGRVFFCYVLKKEIIILHSIIKKTEQTPKTDLEIVWRRLKNVLNEEDHDL